MLFLLFVITISNSDHIYVYLKRSRKYKFLYLEDTNTSYSASVYPGEYLSIRKVYKAVMTFSHFLSVLFTLTLIAWQQQIYVYWYCHFLLLFLLFVAIKLSGKYLDFPKQKIYFILYTLWSHFIFKSFCRLNEWINKKFQN